MFLSKIFNKVPKTSGINFSTLTDAAGIKLARAQATKTEAQNALQEIERLWKTGRLQEALVKVDEVEQKFQECSKAAKFYRGKIGYELLEKSGDLPKNKF